MNPVFWVFSLLIRMNTTWILRDFLNISLVAYSSWFSKMFSDHAFFPLLVHSLGDWLCRMSLLCALHPEQKRSCANGGYTRAPQSPISHECPCPGSCWAPPPRPCIPAVIQGETNHQMFDLLTLLATLNVLSCKLLQGFIFLSFHCLQLLVIVIIKHKWPLLHSARRALPWIKPNYRERVYMMILQVIQRVSCN